VTGDHERYRVCSAGSRDGSSRTWVADAGGHFPVQLHFTVRNGLETLGDKFDFLAYYSDFRVDSQEASSPSDGPVGGNVTGIGQTQRD
jgi:hypothetical protein